MDGTATTGEQGTATGSAIPRRTTPTWEMELLLSGATVFGLLSLPREIDGVFYDGLNHLGADTGALLVPLWVYVRSAVLMLIGTFVLHLALRGWWVALVGLASVYPGPIDWTRLRMGPLQRAVAASAPPVRRRIDAADDRATVVFGVGVGLAYVMLVPLLLVAVAGAISFAARAALGADLGRWTFLAVVAVVVVPFGLLSLLDARLGARLAPDGRSARLLRAAFRGYDRIGFGRASNPLLSLFHANEGSRRTAVVFSAALVAALGVVMAQLLADAGALDVGDFAGLPADEPGAAETVLAAHYATQRGEVRTPAPLPYVQDRVVRGPYLELFVPYRSRRHAPALRAACPDAVAAAERGASPRPALDCLARLLDVRLDGAPEPVQLEASSDPVTGGRGVLAMIPVERLAPGRHELTLLPPPRSDGRAATEPYRIPFWR